MVYVVRAGVREDWKTEAIKGVVGGVAAVGGFGISEFTAEYVVKAANIADAIQKLLAKVGVRIGFGLLFMGISWMTGGIVSWIFLAMAMGSFGGIALDLMEYFGVTPKGAAEFLALSGAGFEEVPADDVQINFEEIGGELEIGRGLTVNAESAEVVSAGNKAVAAAWE